MNVEETLRVLHGQAPYYFTHTLQFRSNMLHVLSVPSPTWRPEVMELLRPQLLICGALCWFCGFFYTYSIRSTLTLHPIVPPAFNLIRGPVKQNNGERLCGCEGPVNSPAGSQYGSIYVCLCFSCVLSELSVDVLYVQYVFEYVQQTSAADDVQHWK